MCKKVLVLGATGAMGRYLVPCLAEMGYRVDGVSVDDKTSDLPNVNYIKANVKDKTVLTSLLKNGYDGIVDFMWYPTSELPFAVPRFLDSTDHYIFLSSCRVYDDLEHPVKETSPRLLDSTKDVLLRNSDDYCIYKARGENLLNGLPKKNWTIVRPATTYSFMRYQLVTLEAANTVGRAFAGKAVVVTGTGSQCSGNYELGRRCRPYDRTASVPGRSSAGNVFRHDIRTSFLGRNRRLLQGYLQSESRLGRQGRLSQTPVG